MNTADRVRDFLIAEQRWPRPAEQLTDDVPLIVDRVLDSMMVMRLVGWLEEEFSISLTHADVVPANFATIGAIADLVDGRRSAV